ncbi:DNA cytosine methyltransferase [Mycolicibacterium sp. GF69]|uniref:DNA cytosine methyltransferase n=1 Tax=Mycolicibacterium sp. GF69 TaxID=2267251 RepID=UPI000DCC5572|nr:DNA cytosine methyltransferase [Mycolicibacterium sp. GF69]RAV16981.1 DNA cytosine methyltransferase [Mycolicibacterium sp. GF69]
MSAFTCVDAFCGAGGLSLGLAAAGIDVVLGFDHDPVAIKTQHANPQWIQHRALEATLQSMLRGRLLDELGMVPGELDFLAGGPPCQGFSVQRTIGNDDDDRNLLVNDYGDLILEVRPRFFLLENVPGLGGRRGRAMLGLFRKRMAANGYSTEQQTLDAQNFGVPQRRRRVILIGMRSREPSLTYQSAGESTRFPWPDAIDDHMTVWDAIGHLPAPPTDGTDHPDVPNHRADKLSAVNLARIRALKAGQGRTHLPRELLADCHQRDADAIGHRNVYGRMTWDDVAPTITARFDSFTRGMFGHPEQDRTVSLREGAILQTFPLDYYFVGSKVEVARQIGNAVPVKFAEIIGRAILLAAGMRDADAA